MRPPEAQREKHTAHIAGGVGHQYYSNEVVPAPKSADPPAVLFPTMLFCAEHWRQAHFYGMGRGRAFGQEGKQRTRASPHVRVVGVISHVVQRCTRLFLPSCRVKVAPLLHSSCSRHTHVPRRTNRKHSRSDAHEKRSAESARKKEPCVHTRWQEMQQQRRKKNKDETHRIFVDLREPGERLRASPFCFLLKVRVALHEPPRCTERPPRPSS